MPVFRYKAKDSGSAVKSGEIEAGSVQDAADILHKRGYTVISLDAAKALRSRRESVSTDDLVVFSRQLATMIESGISLVQALAILSEQAEKKSFKSVIGSMRQDIEEGSSFSEALAKHAGIFPEIFRSMVQAGEASGMLEEILERLAVYIEKSAALRRKIVSSLIYPAVVISMAVIITAVLLLKVVPTFKAIFDILGGQLPLPTKILIFTSDLLRHNILYVIIAAAAAFFLFRKYYATQKGRYAVDKRMLSLPVFGRLAIKVAVVKFSRTLATLVKSGVPILNSLEIVARIAGNKVVEEAVLSARKSIREGEPIAGPLSNSGVFPPMVVRMIGVGEQTGELEKMLTKIADFYDDQVDAAVSGLTSLLEPLVIAFLGIVIGGIVISLFLPIFKITQLIAQ
ncbi:MAG: type II secretion system F family protein [Candidatus Omnitrophica bacterium]|nr:type II secretion system F family protein [Candidatus Omnitrophota bacterium]